MLEEEKKFLKDCGFANVMQLALAYVGLQYEMETLKQNNEILRIQVSSREEVANQYIKAVDELMNYIEKNPKILQNPNILDFCIEIKKIKGEVK